LASNKLRIVPLGGLGEIGKNMMVLEYGRNAIIIDTGIMFPENDMLGIDYIIPDFDYILDKADIIRGIVITHGHEDHTGAITHVLEHVDAPVYATSLTTGLLEVKLRQAKMLDRVSLNTIQAGDVIRLGPFTVETFHVCHSIPDGLGLGIDTPVGMIVHSGDFKIDHTPVDGWPTDFAKLAELSGRGVLALLSDSTNADQPGWTPSETVIDAAFDRVFSAAEGRIIVATFASLISRIQQVANVAIRYGRKMAITGYSMSENVKMAKKLGYLEIPSDLIVSVEEALKLPPEELVMMATGTQGEPSAVLSRLSRGRHRQLTVEPGDTIIMSAHPIPGNEEMVHRTINGLFQRGANVVYDPIESVHVSGHASQEEQKLLINLVQPEFFVPIHGELRHLHAHADLARKLGIPDENIAIIENGTIIEFDGTGMTVGERVPGGYVFVDGSGVGDVGPAVLRDREILARDGFVLALLHRDHDTHKILGEAEIISRGFIYLRESEDLINAARQTIMRIASDGNGRSPRELGEDMQEALGKYLYNETKRRPMVFAFVSDV
jgi:ribonuclease J